MGHQDLPTRVIDTGVAERLEELRRRSNDVSDKRALDLEQPARKVARANQLVEHDVTNVREAERILGSANEMVHAHFLARGAQAARTVALLLKPIGGGRTKALGTGSMMSPRLLITNNHVLEDVRSTARCVVDFDVEYDSAGSLKRPVRFALDPETFFATSPTLDISVVAVAPGEGGGTAGETYGWSPLVDGEDAFVIGERLNVVQHPSGGLKQVSFRENRLLEHDDRRLWYETDTDPGSSGSPVFNDQWVLVAIHRRSVPRTDEQKRPLDKDGVLATRGTPDDRVDWIANEGTRISAVRSWLAELNLSGEAAMLRDECLEG